MDFKSILAAFVALVMISLPSTGWAESRTERLMAQLRSADSKAAAARLERQILDEWSKSGSAAMDLLLKRGNDAVEVEKYGEAVGHFRALTDHAPNFAEGWHGLAIAFFNLERFGPAMDALERVLALNPDHFPAMRGVGAVHEQVGHPALAYEAYERVLELRPFDDDITSALERLEREVKGITL